jgi:hypothetical protein
MSTVTFKEYLIISEHLDTEAAALQEGAVKDMLDAAKGGLETLAKKLGVSREEAQKKLDAVKAAKAKQDFEARRQKKLAVNAARSAIGPRGTHQQQAREKGEIRDDDLSPEDRKLLAKMDARKA